MFLVHLAPVITLLTSKDATLTNLPKAAPKKPAVKVQPVISLEEMMGNLRTRIEKQFKTSFFELKKESTEHKTVIVGFLAILELFKQGNVLITQISRFEDIEVELERGTTPRYY